jgi:hypothetical protein
MPNSRNVKCFYYFFDELSGLAAILSGQQRFMSVTVELNLPDDLAAEARAKGLLEPQSLTRLIQRELADAQGARDFFRMARDLRSLPGEPMTMGEIQEIVDGVRKERAAGEAGH